jgi:peptide/nickel transport system substrate-binding protein
MRVIGLRPSLLAAATGLAVVACERSTPPASTATAVVLVGQQATRPIPMMMEDAAHRTTANTDVADVLFLRLAAVGRSNGTSGDDGFEPQLARRWTRQDSVTLVFELDPRARWHDSTPVTSRDVVFTFDRARDTALSPTTSQLLKRIAAVEADGDHRVVVRFTQPYSEQLYDATFHVQPLPQHLLGGRTAAELDASPFMANPIGNGAFRWVRSVPDQLVELAGNPDFFLGRPGLARVVFRTVPDADARINLMLSGEGDAVAAPVPPISNRERLAAVPSLRLVSTPSTTVGYLLFNTRLRGDSTRPHPILGDVRVRRALGLALDREAMAQSAFGPNAKIPYGPVSQGLWIANLLPPAAVRDTAAARTLLADAGWRDSDGDGTLDRGGKPLRLTLSLPGPSAVRKQLALQAQEQLRAVGVRLDLALLEGPVWAQQRAAGDFEIDFSSANQDPTPAGLTQSWSCRGGSNVARYCNPVVDSLMDRAILARDAGADTWKQVAQLIEADAPAVFLYSPVAEYAVSTRYDEVVIRPTATWSDLWRWTVSADR